jgi:hypothetical protein
MKRLLLLVLLMFSVITTSQAGGIDKKKLPSLLAGSNAGNEFYISFPPCYDEESPGGEMTELVEMLEEPRSSKKSSSKSIQSF